MKLELRQSLATALIGLAGLASTGTAMAGVCGNGATFDTVSYFKPAAGSYPQYVNQGGYHLSLCNTAHGTPAAGATCHTIDLKAYLYKPASGTTKSGLPAVLWVDGSFSNDANPAVPNPNNYPTACPQAKYFTDKGYLFIAIVRRGYIPSTGENEVVRGANSTLTGAAKQIDGINYLANQAFEAQLAVNYLDSLKADNNKPLVNPKRIGYAGHSLGGIVGLFFGTSGNTQPIQDAGIASGLTSVRAKALLAPASQSWDGFDRLGDGVLDDSSQSIDLLTRAASHSLVPTYFLEPLNDQSYRPVPVFAKAAADFQLEENRTCRDNITGGLPPTDQQIRQIVDTCPHGREVQMTLFPVVDISGDPDATSAHGAFDSDPSIWGPAMSEFYVRHGVKK